MRLLGVRVGGHHRLSVLVGHREQHALQFEQRPFGAQQLVAEDHAVHRNAEVVAAAREVEVAGGLARRLGDEVLHVEEEVLELGGVGGGLESRHVQAGYRPHDGVCVLAGDQAPLGEHDQVRLVGGEHRRQQLSPRVLVGWLEDYLPVSRPREAPSLPIEDGLAAIQAAPYASWPCWIKLSSDLWRLRTACSGVISPLRERLNCSAISRDMSE